MLNRSVQGYGDLLFDDYPEQAERLPPQGIGILRPGRLESEDESSGDRIELVGESEQRAELSRGHPIA